MKISLQIAISKFSNLLISCISIKYLKYTLRSSIKGERQITLDGSGS